LEARLNHGLQRLALMGHEPLGRFHQIGNEVMASLELHVDLGKGIPVTIAQLDQSVVAPDQPKDDQEHGNADHQ
jgi:hypothetical protein